MAGLSLGELRSTPNALARHYSRFRVSERLLLTGHSHQAWPDVARDGVLEAIDDAAREVDEKWELAEARAELVREGFRRLLDDPGGEIALAASTHELVVRWLSALPISRGSRLVTTSGEFHTLRRQLARLAEEGVEVVHVDPEPVGSLAERVAAAIDDRHYPAAAVLISAVFFETGRIVPRLGELAADCSRRGIPLLVDAYHALGALPFSLRELGLESALVTGGGYKYLQLGEGNCFLRLPKGLNLRPLYTGWFAEFATKTGAKVWDGVDYGTGAAAFAGSTYDPTSHYRGAHVFAFFAQQGLTPRFLREISQHQVGQLAEGFDRMQLPASAIRRPEADLRDLGGFLALESDRAVEISRALHARGVATDARGRSLRLGPAPYLSDAQLDEAIRILAEVVRAL